MKPFIQLLFLCYLFSLPVQATDIETLLKLGQITVKANGVGNTTGSSNYGPCITVKITNRGATPLSVELKPGQFLMPDDTGVQRMMCTRKAVFTLKAHETLVKKVYAMCTQLHKSAPDGTISFNIKNKAAGKLMALANFLSTKNYQSGDAQLVVWAVTDNNGFNLSNNSAEARDLNAYYLKNIGKPRRPIEKNSIVTHVNPESLVHHITGTVDYTLNDNRTVSIKLFNEKEELLATLVNNKEQAAGNYKYSFNFDVPSGSSGGKFVYVHYYLDGVKVSEDFFQLADSK